MGILSPIEPQLGTFLKIAQLVCVPVQHRLRNERASLQNSIFDVRGSSVQTRSKTMNRER
jgi:hypothetical protein